MIEHNTTRTVDPVGFWSRLSWKAVITGAVTAAALHAMLVLVGLGVGLISADSLYRAEGVSIAMGVWWLLSGAAAIFAGAWIAGRFTATHDRLDGALAGVVTWSLLTVVSAWMAAAATGSLVGGAFTLTTRAAETLVSTQNIDLDRAAQNFTSDRGPDGARAGDSGAARADAAPRLDTAEARQAAEEASDAVGQAALWTAFMLLLGLVAGAAGGAVGNNNGQIVRTRYERTTPVARADNPDTVRARTHSA